MRAAFASLVTGRRLLWTTSFVIVETIALLQHRIGRDGAKDFDEEVLPAVRVRWVDDHLYRLGIDRFWREDRRQVSLVDCVSFEFMRMERVGAALAVDVHFADAGFDVLPRAR